MAFCDDLSRYRYVYDQAMALQPPECVLKYDKSGKISSEYAKFTSFYNGYNNGESTINGLNQSLWGDDVNIGPSHSLQIDLSMLRYYLYLTISGPSQSSARAYAKSALQNILLDINSANDMVKEKKSFFDKASDSIFKSRNVLSSVIREINTLESQGVLSPQDVLCVNNYLTDIGTLYSQIDLLKAYNGDLNETFKYISRSIKDMLDKQQYMKNLIDEGQYQLVMNMTAVFSNVYNVYLEGTDGIKKCHIVAKPPVENGN